MSSLNTQYQLQKKSEQLSIEELDLTQEALYLSLDLFEKTQYQLQTYPEELDLRYYDLLCLPDEFNIGDDKSIPNIELPDEFNRGDDKSIPNIELPDEFNIGDDKSISNIELPDEFNRGDDKSISNIELPDEFNIGDDKSISNIELPVTLNIAKSFIPEDLLLDKTNWASVFSKKHIYYNNSDLKKIKMIRRKLQNRISAKKCFKNKINTEKKLLVIIKTLEISNARLYIENKELIKQLNSF